MVLSQFIDADPGARFQFLVDVETRTRYRTVNVVGTMFFQSPRFVSGQTNHDRSERFSPKTRNMERPESFGDVTSAEQSSRLRRDAFAPLYASISSAYYLEVFFFVSSPSVQHVSLFCFHLWLFSITRRLQISPASSAKLPSARTSSVNYRLPNRKGKTRKEKKRLGKSSKDGWAIERRFRSATCRCTNLVTVARIVFCFRAFMCLFRGGLDRS